MNDNTIGPKKKRLRTSKDIFKMMGQILNERRAGLRERLSQRMVIEENDRVILEHPSSLLSWGRGVIQA